MTQLNPKRKRGAQPGNTNAVQHGFYATRINSADYTDIHGHQFPGLQEEAQLMRLFIRRLVETSSKAPATTLDQATSALRVLTLATTSLAHLLRTEQILNSHRPMGAPNGAFSRMIAMLDQLAPPEYDEDGDPLPPYLSETSLKLARLAIHEATEELDAS